MRLPFSTSPFRPQVLLSSLVLSLVTQILCWATPVEAQGFFQQLLGLSPSPQVRSAPRPVAPRQSVGGVPMQIEPQRMMSQPRSDKVHVPPEGSGSYTTVCVRMCDGFYFPISHRVPRSRFHRDADVCSTRCGETEAQLFYYSSSSGDMKSAVDLTGRAYSRLPIAFLHRKKLVDGCGCKPAPWSSAALRRHEGYAIAEGRPMPAPSNGGGSVTVVAGNYSDKRPTEVDQRSANDRSADVTSTEEPAKAPQNAGPTTIPVAATSRAFDGKPRSHQVVAIRRASERQPARAAVNRHQTAARATKSVPAAKPVATAAAPAQRKPTRMASGPMPMPPASGAQLAQPAAASGGGLFGGSAASGPSKYVWPGDPR